MPVLPGRGMFIVLRDLCREPDISKLPPLQARMGQGLHRWDIHKGVSEPRAEAKEAASASWDRGGAIA
jgi:hypothetical protein